MTKLIRNLLIAITVCFISISLSFFLSAFEPARRIQNSVYDYFFRKKSQINKNLHALTKDVVIVAIDDSSLKILQDRMSQLWPWSRDFYGLISGYLVDKGAKAVVFDIIFSSPDIDRNNSLGEETDAAFNSVIKKTNKVILAYDINKDGETDSSEKLDTLNIENGDKFRHIQQYDSITAPYKLFTENNKNFGFVEINEDKDDGVIREYQPFVKIKNKYYPSLSCAIYLLANSNSLPEDLPINKNGAFRINWYGAGGIENTFKYVKADEVINDAVNKKRGKALFFPEDTFRNKVVFIGATARGLLDMKVTPVSNMQVFPGVEIHATSYLNLVQKSWLKDMNPFHEYPLYFIIIFLFIYISITTKSPFRNSAVFFICILLAVFFIHFVLFYKFYFMPKTSYFIIAISIAFVASLAANYLTVGRNRSAIKRALGTYLHPDLVKKVAESDKPLVASGEEAVASAMFIDIAGFTSYSEKNPVGKVVETLNLYLRKFSDAIINNRGYVNKYLGDGLMALFGAPTYFEDHADMAVKSAFECYKINKELSAEYGLDIRIGVNSGSMIKGDLGGGRKLEYSAIGDPVNTASRLEGANKFFSTNIMVGNNTYELLKDKYEISYIGKFNLKGKDIAYGIYYFTEARAEYRENFSKMIQAYENNDLKAFAEMMKYFSGIKDRFGPALFYMNYYVGNKEKFSKPIKFTEK